MAMINSTKQKTFIASKRLAEYLFALAIFQRQQRGEKQTKYYAYAALNMSANEKYPAHKTQVLCWSVMDRCQRLFIAEYIIQFSFVYGILI